MVLVAVPIIHEMYTWSAQQIFTMDISPRKLPNFLLRMEVDAFILESFVNQTAMAMERVILAKEAHEERLKAEAQNVRNTFLSSVSHDLRSPLAVVAGAASTLLEKDMSLDRQARLELLRTIHEETDRLERIIRNVLNLTRLEAGAITVHKEWQPLEEIIGVVLNRLSERLKEHPLELKIPRIFPFFPLTPF